MPKGEIVSVFDVGNCFWQPYRCLKANIQMMYFQICCLWLSGTNPGAVSWRIEDLQGVRQGVLEGVSEDVPDV